MAELVVRLAGQPDRMAVISRETFKIGKRASNDLVLEHPKVSRDHCEIVTIQGRLFIRDLKSTNGTMVNGNYAKGLVVLNDGDEIKVGDYVLTFKR